MIAGSLSNRCQLQVFWNLEGEKSCASDIMHIYKLLKPLTVHFSRP